MATEKAEGAIAVFSRCNSNVSLDQRSDRSSACSHYNRYVANMLLLGDFGEEAIGEACDVDSHWFERETNKKDPITMLRRDGERRPPSPARAKCGRRNFCLLQRTRSAKAVTISEDSPMPESSEDAGAVKLAATAHEIFSRVKTI